MSWEAFAGNTSNSKAAAVSAVPARAVPPSRRDKAAAAAPGPAQPGLQRAGTGQPPQQGAHLSLGLSLTDICTGNDFSCTGSVSGSPSKRIGSVPEFLTSSFSPQGQRDTARAALPSGAAAPSPRTISGCEGRLFGFFFLLATAKPIIKI